MSAADTVQTAANDPGAAMRAKRFRLYPYDTEVGPVAHLRAAREKLARLSWKHFDARPLGTTLGAEVSGLDLRRDLPDEVVAELRQALLAYKVLFFRNQPLSASEHVAFAGRFGELELHPFIPSNTEHPELVRFEKSPEVGGYENQWHSDVSWRECPSMGAVLHAIEVPEVGGDTLWADMAAVYRGLDEQIQQRIEKLTATHDYLRAFGHQVSDDAKQKMREKYPQAHHPIVRTHPETGEKILYANRIFSEGIDGLEPEESCRLLDRLAKEAEYPEYQVRFHWEKDSVAFWDNRSTQHYAASDYWPETRIMERASIVGDRPR